MKAIGLVQRNIIANYFGAIVLVTAPLLALPFYLHLLGPKLFGLISFVTAIQTLLSLLDSGISQVAVRELSVRFSDKLNGSLNTAKLLFGFERIYWAFSAIAATITILLAGYISNHWLKLDTIDLELGREAVIGAAMLFLVQFPGSLYRSFLVASEAQVALNTIMSSGLLMRHIGGVLLVTFFPSLETYLIWLVFSAALETLLRAVVSWRKLGVKRRSLSWKFSLVQELLPDITKLSGAVLLGSLASQIDKIILSKMVSIEQFGYYTIASTLSLGVVNLIYPLVQGVAPRIMRLSNSPLKLYELSKDLFTKILMMVIFGALIFILVGKALLSFWLNNPPIVSIVYEVLSILLIGSAFNAVYHVGFYYWLSKSKTNRIYLVNISSLLLSLIFIPIFVDRYGMVGATFGFVMLNFIGLVISLEWIKERHST